MIVGNFYFARIAVPPNKAYSPLIIYSNAILSSSITFQCFQFFRVFVDLQDFAVAEVTDAIQRLGKVDEHIAVVIDGNDDGASSRISREPERDGFTRPHQEVGRRNLQTIENGST